jgi:hypothetical protein
MIATSRDARSNSWASPTRSESLTTSLHLKDVIPQRKSCIEWPAQHAKMTAMPRTSAAIDKKQREHLRLFNEYLACCKGSNCDVRIRPLSSYNALIVCNECQDNPCQPKEIYSFLPPTRGGTSRKAFAPSSSSAITGLCHGGRDIPVSARRPPLPPRSPPCDSPEGPHGEPHSSAALPPPSLLAVQEEGRVYRSQVATALHAGRAVWL